nr:MAG TPA: hypothetical protein [Caudoviricetes sp.]
MCFIAISFFKKLLNTILSKMYMFLLLNCVKLM